MTARQGHTIEPCIEKIITGVNNDSSAPSLFLDSNTSISHLRNSWYSGLQKHKLRTKILWDFDLSNFFYHMTPNKISLSWRHDFKTFYLISGTMTSQILKIFACDPLTLLAIFGRSFAIWQLNRKRNEMSYCLILYFFGHWIMAGSHVVIGIRI